MEKEKNPYQLDVVSVRLVKDAPLCSDTPIQSPQDAVKLIGGYLCEMDREVLCILNMRTDGIPLNCNFVSMGSVNETIAHPREIFKSTILCNATGILMIHVHPSGNLSPSKEDTRLTDRMIKNCEMMGIELLDHVIVGGDNREFFSFKEKKLLKSQAVPLQNDYQMLQFESQLVAESGRAR